MIKMCKCFFVVSATQVLIIASTSVARCILNWLQTADPSLYPYCFLLLPCKS